MNKYMDNSIPTSQNLPTIKSMNSSVQFTEECKWELLQKGTFPHILLLLYKSMNARCGIFPRILQRGRFGRSNKFKMNVFIGTFQGHSWKFVCLICT